MATPVVGGSHLLWPTLTDAYRYAEARHLLFHTRQVIRPERYGDRLMWWVGKARRQEECRCS